MQALDDLGKKLDMLLKKYGALEAENKRLRDTIASQSKSALALQSKIASLEHNMVSVRMDGGGSDEERKNMRKQLDTVIAEIDKILNTLND